MAGDVFWIKLMTSTFDSETIMLLESMPEGDTILVIWIKLQVLAGKCNAGGYLILNGEYPYSDEMLATVFRRQLNTVRLAIAAFLRFKMVEIIDGAYFLPEWEKYQNVSGLEKIREQTRQRVARHRAKLKDVTLQVTHGNDAEIETETEIDIIKQQQVIQHLLKNTPFCRVTVQELCSLANRHGGKQLMLAADIAAETWRREKKEIRNPGGYLQTLCMSHVLPDWYEPPEVRNARLKTATDRKLAEARKVEEQRQSEERESRKRDDFWYSLSQQERQKHLDNFKGSAPFVQDFNDEILENIAKLNAWDNRSQMSTNAIGSSWPNQ